MRQRDRAVKIEWLEARDEATKALTLAVVGLMAIMLIPNLVMLLWH
jgi:hypothetical protein